MYEQMFESKPRIPFDADYGVSNKRNRPDCSKDMYVNGVRLCRLENLPCALVANCPIQNKTYLVEEDA